MNKMEFIDAIASKTEATKADTTKFVDAMITVVQETLAEKEEISIMKFGKFHTSLVKGRTGKNPLDPKKKIEIPDTWRVYFTAGKGLKDAANGRTASKKASTKKASSKKKVAKKKKK